MMTQYNEIYKSRSTVLVRIMSIVLISAFIYQNITWAYPDSIIRRPSQGADKLAPPSFFGDEKNIELAVVKSVEVLIEGKPGIMDRVLLSTIVHILEDNIGWLNNNGIRPTYGKDDKGETYEILISFRGFTLRYYDPTSEHIKPGHGNKRELSKDSVATVIINPRLSKELLKVGSLPYTETPAMVAKATEKIIPKVVSAENFAEASAREVAEKIRLAILNLSKSKEKINLVLTQGNTMVGFLRKLAKEGGIDWSKVNLLQMTEYKDIPPDSAFAFRSFLQEYFLDNLPENNKVPPGNIYDILTIGVNSYRAELVGDMHPDIIVLGLGMNGHVGLNEPGSSFESRTREVKLTDETIRYDAAYEPILMINSKTGRNPTAYTVGMAEIASADHIFLLVNGGTKREIIERALYGPVSVKVPASMLQTLTGKVTVILDQETAFGLSGASVPVVSSIDDRISAMATLLRETGFRVNLSEAEKAEFLTALAIGHIDAVVDGPEIREILAGFKPDDPDDKIITGQAGIKKFESFLQNGILDYILKHYVEEMHKAPDKPEGDDKKLDATFALFSRFCNVFKMPHIRERVEDRKRLLMTFMLINIRTPDSRIGSQARSDIAKRLMMDQILFNKDPEISGFAIEAVISLCEEEYYLSQLYPLLRESEDLPRFAIEIINVINNVEGDVAHIPRIEDKDKFFVTASRIVKKLVEDDLEKKGGHYFIRKILEYSRAIMMLPEMSQRTAVRKLLLEIEEMLAKNIGARIADPLTGVIIHDLKNRLLNTDILCGNILSEGKNMSDEDVLEDLEPIKKYNEMCKKILDTTLGYLEGRYNTEDTMTILKDGHDDLKRLTEEIMRRLDGGRYKWSTDTLRWVTSLMEETTLGLLPLLQSMANWLDRTMSAIDVEEIITKSIASMPNRWLKSIKVNIDIKPDDKGDLKWAKVLYTHKLILQMALEELMRNASKYSKTEKLDIVVSLAEGGEIKIDVIDYGKKGISPEDLIRIFAAPGFTTATDKRTGTGYGLHSLKETIESMGGMMEVKSEPGRTQCSFTLPINAPLDVVRRPVLTEPVVVAVSGLKGSGRQVIAQWLAAKLGLRYIDAGSLVRVILHEMLSKPIDLNSETEIVAFMKELFRSDRLQYSVSSLSVDGMDITVPNVKGITLNDIIKIEIDRNAENTETLHKVFAYPLVKKTLNAFLRSVAAEIKKSGKYNGIVLSVTDPLQEDGIIDLMLYAPANIRALRTNTEIGQIARLDELTGKTNMRKLYADVNVLDTTSISRSTAEEALRSVVLQLPSRTDKERWFAKNRDSDQLSEEGTAGDGIGKFIEIKPVKFNKSDGLVHGVLKNIDTIDTKERLDLAKINQRRAPPKEVEKYIQTLESFISENSADSQQKQFLNRLVSLFRAKLPQNVIITQEVKAGFFGTGKPDLLVINESILNNPVSFLHEMAEYLKHANPGLIRKDMKDLLSKEGLAWLRSHKAKYAVKGMGQYFSDNIDHYIIRAFTRQAFEAKDQLLKQEMKAELKEKGQTPLPVKNIPTFSIKYHGEILDYLKRIRRENPNRNIAVFNFDAHTDREKGKSINASWAYEAEAEGIVAEVFHMETLWKKKKGIREVWQNPDFINLVKMFLRKQDTLVVISIDFDYFSLSEEVLEEREWEDIYHRSPDEVRAMMKEIAVFVKSSRLSVAGIVMAESQRYLATEADQSYIEMLKAECGKLSEELANKGDISDSNVTCGTICEAGHQELLDPQLDAYYKGLATKAGIDKSILGSDDVLNALGITGKLSQLGTTKEQLAGIIKYIREKGQIPDTIELLFATPPDNKMLWWIDNPDYKLGSQEEKQLYAGGHFNGAGTRIHISLPLIISILKEKGIDTARDAALAIAQHELSHIKGEDVPHTAEDPGMGIVMAAAEREARIVEPLTAAIIHDLKGRLTPTIGFCQFIVVEVEDSESKPDEDVLKDLEPVKKSYEICNEIRGTIINYLDGKCTTENTLMVLSDGLDDLARFNKAIMERLARGGYNWSEVAQEKATFVVRYNNSQVLPLLQSTASWLDKIMSAVDVQGIIEEILVSMRGSELLLGDVKVNVELAEDLKHPTGLSTHKLILQVALKELIFNALKYSGSENKKLDITASLVGDGELEIDVRDYGVGILPENLGKLFTTPGFTTATDKRKGTGYGLYALKETIESVGGKMWVKSEPGHGACFSFTLPVNAPLDVVRRPMLTEPAMVAVSGLKGSGRQVMSQWLAAKLGLRYIDAGFLTRVILHEMLKGMKDRNSIPGETEILAFMEELFTSGRLHYSVSAFSVDGIDTTAPDDKGGPALKDIIKTEIDKDAGNTRMLHDVFAYPSAKRRLNKFLGKVAADIKESGKYNGIVLSVTDPIQEKGIIDLMLDAPAGVRALRTNMAPDWIRQLDKDTGKSDMKKLYPGVRVIDTEFIYRSTVEEALSSVVSQLPTQIDKERWERWLSRPSGDVNDWNVYVLAGGYGTRMGATVERPKPTIEVGGKPIYSYVLGKFKALGLKTTLLTGFGASALKGSVDKFYGEKAFRFVEVSAGKANNGNIFLPLREMIRAEPAENIMIVNVDDIYPNDNFIREVMAKHFALDDGAAADATVLTVHKENPKHFGRIIRDKNGNFIEIVEQMRWEGKPDIMVGTGTPYERVMSTGDVFNIKEVNTNVMVFKKSALLEILDDFEKRRTEFLISEMLAEMIKKGMAVKTVPLKDEDSFVSCNTPEDIVAAEEVIKKWASKTEPVGEDRKRPEGPEAKTLADIHGLIQAGILGRPLNDGTRILLSENLFIKDGDEAELAQVRIALAPLLESGHIAIIKPDEMRRAATNQNVSKNKLAIVLTKEDFDNKELWKDSDKETALKSSLLILDDRLTGNSYLYLEGVVGLARAVMSNNKQAIRTYYELISDAAIGDEILGLLSDDSQNNVAFAIRAILRFKSMSRIDPKNLDELRIRMENFLIAA